MQLIIKKLKTALGMMYLLTLWYCYVHKVTNCTCEAAKLSFSRPTTYLFFIFTIVPRLVPSSDLKEEISSR